VSLGVALGAQIGGGAAFAVRAEARVTAGAPGLSIVGLADKAVGEAKERVAAALETSGILSLASRAARVVVSLSPADLKKTGSHLDLAVACACMEAAGVTKGRGAAPLVLGELALDGSILPCRGALAMVEAARASGATEAIVPRANAEEASAIGGVSVRAADSLREVAAHLSGRRELPLWESAPPIAAGDVPTPRYDTVRGQSEALRAAEIAIAGGHNFAMIGPPGTGKTTLARACSEIMPPLSEVEAVEVARVASLAGQSVTFPVARPFRAPHHTSTYAALVGGGSDLRPGEAARAHRGVLFLDELPEFERRALDALREPIEDGVVRVARAAGSATFPARFALVAAMNPCPCGFAGDSRRECRCAPGVAARYGAKVSGPIADRIDVWARVSSPRTEEVVEGGVGATGAGKAARERVTAARKIQEARAVRIGLAPWTTNAELPDRALLDEPFEPEARRALAAAAERLGLSARGVTRAMRVARTIADLAGSEPIGVAHALEAIGYRDRR
jgi:magnesium chelatase family protein